MNLARSYRALERFDEAVSHDRDALAAFRGLDDEHGQARALAGLGELHQLLDRDAEAVGYRRQALLLYRRAGDRYAEAEVLDGLGTSYSRLGRPEQAVRAWRGAHSILTDIAHPRAEEVERHLAGAAAGHAGRLPEQRSYARSR